MNLKIIARLEKLLFLKMRLKIGRAASAKVQPVFQHIFQHISTRISTHRIENSLTPACTTRGLENVDYVTLVLVFSAYHIGLH